MRIATRSADALATVVASCTNADCAVSVNLTLGQIIRQARADRGLTQGQLATYANVTRSWISLVESGHRLQPDPDMIRRVASVLRIPEDTLLAYAGYNVKPLPMRGERSSDEILAELRVAMERERKQAEREAAEARRKWFEEEARFEVVHGQKVVMVPVVEGFAAAGEGAVAELNYIPYIPTPEEAGHSFMSIDVKGSCLAPRLNDGERVVIDKNAEPYDGCVVAVQYQGESILRVLKGGYLVSYNGHAPIPLSEDIKIEGVVVFVGRRP